jgi:hypothetical protein
MAKLNSLDIPDAASKKAKTEIPTVVVTGDIVTRYNEARDAADRAEEILNELKPTLTEEGLQGVFNHNAQHPEDPKARISSVNLKDDATGEIVQFSWTKKNLKCDPKQVEAEFNTLRTVDGKKANVNDYVGYEIAASFDTKVFMVDGKFNRNRYDQFMTAIQQVAADLGVDNPLTCGKVLVPKADFHDKRWQAFNVEDNLWLQQLLPTQCSLKPIRPEAD